MTARRVGLLTTALLVGAAGSVLYLHPLEMDPWHRRSPFETITQIDNAAVGATEQELREVYGEPTRERFGLVHSRHDGIRSRLRLFTAPVRDLSFRANQATVSVFLEKRGQEWVCFESTWWADEGQELRADKGPELARELNRIFRRARLRSLLREYFFWE